MMDDALPHLRPALASPLLRAASRERLREDAGAGLRRAPLGIAGPSAEEAPSELLLSGSLEAFAEIWPSCERPGEGRAHVFQTADVLRVWLDTMGPARGVEPFFAAVLDGAGRPMLLMPLGIERRAGARALAFLDGDVSDYNAPVLFPGGFAWDAAAVAHLMEALRALLPPFDLIRFEKMAAEVGGLPNPLMLLGAERNPEDGHATTLKGDWEAFARTRIPRRQDSRRKLRKLATLGPVRFHLAATPEEVETFCEAMIRQKARRFAETEVEGFQAPGKLAYFREAARRLGAGGPVKLFAMTVGDEIVATHLGMVGGGRFYHLMPGYAAGPWRPHSPGKFMNEHLIEWSFGQGLRDFDFGVGDEGYKLEYCDAVVALHQVVRPVTARGAVSLAATRFRETLRRTALWQLLRRAKWRLLKPRQPVGSDA